MGVNMQLADERDLAGIELRYPDGQAWSGRAVQRSVVGWIEPARPRIRDEVMGSMAGGLHKPADI